LNLPHLGLQGSHSSHLADLLESKGQSNQPDQNSKGDDGDAHVVKEDYVQHQQGVEHRPDNHLIPEE
jgi:hypothetical protein